MDFFEAQDESRRITKILVIFFVIAVLCIIALTNLLVLTVVHFSDSAQVMRSPFDYSWQTFAGISAVVILIVLAGSLYRIFSLAGGGEKVADMMGGKRLIDHGGDLRLRRLLNVVEEMAIASGTPVPPVYLIEDEAINAFAAGYSPGDAVIGITRGAVENLNREQLQGVIAHEFSHVLNGDMRLNIRLMGVLFGILMLAVIGRIMLSSGRGYGTRSRRDGGSAVLAIGVGLLVIGFVGKFFGSVIKAAVSRQREFLADASAVQFTRNPEGIGGALMRIGGYPAGSIVDNPEAEELSHAFFSEGVKTMFTSVMATHPPLKQRIMRINSNWDGTFITEPPAAPSASEFAGVTSGFAAGAASASDAGINADSALAGIGQPSGSQLQQARDMIAMIPTALADAAHEAYSARAVVYLVLLDPVDPLISSRQQDHLKESADVFVLSRFRELLPLQGEITPAMRLPLLEMAMPSLRQLSRPQYERFIENVDALIRADQKIGLSEWALKKYLTRNLEAAFDGRRFGSKIKSLADAKPECEVLLSMLAYSDSDAGVSPEAAFAAGAAELDIEVTLQDKRTLKLSRLNDAVDRLAELRPLRKPKLLKACIATITADRVVAPVEKELVRAIADALDCPMPPIE